MRVLIVGLGIQGYKRRSIAGIECIATVDPANSDADYRNIADISPAEYEAVLICESDEEKIKAEQASMLTARYLWNFLSGMTSKHNLKVAA